MRNVLAQLPRPNWQHFYSWVAAAFMLGFWLWLPNRVFVSCDTRNAEDQSEVAAFGFMPSVTTETRVYSFPLEETPVPEKAETPKPAKAAKVFTPHLFTTKLSSPEDKLVQAYVKRFYETAQKETKVSGQPASVKLAQALLESGKGQSTLAVKANNHFGVKCFSKTCKRGHCTNHNDDHHKDFFRVYETPWESFRAHSKFLLKKRYEKCRKAKGYAAWCRCLSEAGYATDPRYADKLIGLIEKYKLYQFD